MVLSFLLSVFLGFSTAQPAPEKMVIGVFGGEGFFSSFVGVVNSLIWADRNQVVPVVQWDKGYTYYQPQGMREQPILGSIILSRYRHWLMSKVTSCMYLVTRQEALMCGDILAKGPLPRRCVLLATR